MKKITQSALDYLTSFDTIDEWGIKNTQSFSDAFGVICAVRNIADPNEEYDAVFLLSDGQNQYLQKLKDFLQLSDRLKEESADTFSEFVLFHEQWIEISIPGDGTIIFMMLFKRGSLGKSLSEMIGFDNSKFSCSPDPDFHREVMGWLFEFLRKTEGKFTHSYICPDLLRETEDGFKLILPGFVELLAETTQKNITSVLHQCPDLEVYPLAPEFIKNLNYASGILQKTDHWAVGIMDSLLISGKPPFTIQDEPQYLTAVGNNSLQLFEVQDPALLHRLGSLLKLDPNDRQIPDFIENYEVVQKSVPQRSGTGINIDPSESFMVEVGNETDIAVRIIFDELTAPSTIPDKGRKFSLIPDVALSISAGEGYSFTILPAPEIQTLPSESSFIIKNGYYEINLAFRLNKSIIEISEIVIEVGDPESGKAHRFEGVRSDHINKKIECSSARSVPIEHKFAKTDQFQFIVSKNYEIQVSLNLKDWGQYDLEAVKIELQNPGIPELEANLNNFWYPTNIRDRKQIPIVNTGGERIIIQDVILESLSNSVRVNLPDDAKNKNLEPGQKVNFDWVVNTHRALQGESETGYIIVTYRTASSTRAMQEKFPYTVNIDDQNNQIVDIAIDFGTSNTCLYFKGQLNEGIFEWRKSSAFGDKVLSQNENKYIPSFICYSENYEDPLWGQHAKDIFIASSSETGSVFHSVKRELSKNSAKLSVKIKEGTFSKQYLDIARDFLQLVVNRLRFDERLNIRNVYLAYPTGYTGKRVDDYKRIIDEVTKSGQGKIEAFDEALSGAYQYLLDKDGQDKYYLIYDFGGGTTDILLAEYSTENAGGPFGGKKHVIKKIISTGYDIGGEDLNEWLSLLVQELLLEKKDGGLIPYVKRSDIKQLNTVVINPAKGFKDAVKDAGTHLWELTENLKIYDFKLEQLQNDIKVPVIDKYEIDNWVQWNQHFLGNGNTVANDFNIAANLDQEFLNKVRARFIEELNNNLGKKIQNIASYIKPVVKDEKVKIILLGQSSKLEPFQSLVKQVLANENINFELELPSELKTVVVTGCFKLGSGTKRLDVDSTYIQKYLKMGEDILITPNKKVTKEPLYEFDEYAIWSSPSFYLSDMQDVVDLYEHENPFDSPRKVSLDFTKVKQSQGISLKQVVVLHLYYNLSRELCWLIVDTSGKKIGESN